VAATDRPIQQTDNSSAPSSASIAAVVLALALI
jgi:hypothetical protein